MYIGKEGKEDTGRNWRADVDVATMRVMFTALISHFIKSGLKIYATACETSLNSARAERKLRWN